jgi:hypothetical protein
MVETCREERPLAEVQGDPTRVATRSFSPIVRGPDEFRRKKSADLKNFLKNGRFATKKEGANEKWLNKANAATLCWASSVQIKTRSIRVVRPNPISLARRSRGLP